MAIKIFKILYIKLLFEYIINFTLQIYIRENNKKNKNLS